MALANSSLLLQMRQNSDGFTKYHLDIQLETLVTRVRFDETELSQKAIGVDFLQGKSLYRADSPSKRYSIGRDSCSVMPLERSSFQLALLIRHTF